MPTPHAGFATVSVLSESLMNRCLETYVNTFLNGLISKIRRTVPTVVSGTPLVFDISANAALLSARARLRKNAQGSIFLIFRFYAVAQVDVLLPNSSTPVAHYEPEIAIDVDITAGLIAQVINDQFLFGVNLAQSYTNSITVTLLSQGSLPNAYRSNLINALQSPATRATLDATIHSIAQHNLIATTGTVPAFYDFTMLKPVQPGEIWASARIAAGRLLYWPLDGALAVAIDVPGYTNGYVHDLHDFRGNSDIASATNLDFIQAFLARVVLPQMRDAFLKSNIRIDRVRRFDFQSRQFVNGTANYIEVEFDCSYWTHDFLHFFVAGTTKVSNVIVTMQAAPYLVGDNILVKVGKIEADLPAWLDTLLFVISLILPPVTLFIPAMLQGIIHNALVDVSNKLNGQASQNGLLIREDFTLPKTSSPQYRFTPDSYRMDCTPAQRYAKITGSIQSLSKPELRVLFEDQSITVRTDVGRYEIRRNGGLPVKMIVRMFIPRGIVQTKDPTLRIRFETYFNGNPVPQYTRDVRYYEPFGSVFFGGGAPNELDIDTINIVRPNKLDQEIRITCRLYRSLGGVTEDLYNGSVYIMSVDPRPDEVKPYVQWSHWVKYWNGYERVSTVRHSKIHKAPGKGGCRFSNQYLRYPNTRKFVSLRRFTGLPFEILDLEANRDKVCPYCFFGGPDKHYGPFKSEYDLTGVVGKLFKP